MAVIRSVSLNFVMQGSALIEEWLEKHKEKYEECIFSVNTAMIDKAALDLIMRITPERTRVMRVSMGIRHHLHDITLRMGSYEVNPVKNPKRKISLLNVVGKADYSNIWHFPQQVLSDLDEDNRVEKLLKTMMGNIPVFLFEPYPSPLVQTLR